jgi:hypothetical protein
MLLTETETSFARPVVRGARELGGPGNMMCGFQNVVERQRTRLAFESGAAGATGAALLEEAADLFANPFRE